MSSWFSNWETSHKIGLCSAYGVDSIWLFLAAIFARLINWHYSTSNILSIANVIRIGCIMASGGHERISSLTKNAWLHIGASGRNHGGTGFSGVGIARKSRRNDCGGGALGVGGPRGGNPQRCIRHGVESTNTTCFWGVLGTPLSCLTTLELTARQHVWVYGIRIIVGGSDYACPFQSWVPCFCQVDRSLLPTVLWRRKYMPFSLPPYLV
jgi:hypothetical protein